MNHSLHGQLGCYWRLYYDAILAIPAIPPQSPNPPGQVGNQRFEHRVDKTVCGQITLVMSSCFSAAVCENCVTITEDQRVV